MHEYWNCSDSDFKIGHFGFSFHTKAFQFENTRNPDPGKSWLLNKFLNFERKETKMISE